MDSIKLDHITYQYPLTKVNALYDVSYTFEKGKFYGIIGANGSGKTTLCNVLRGLIPSFYKGTLTGNIFFDGEPLSDLDLDQIATRIGYVFQNPFTQISGIKETVFEEIAMGLENLGVNREEIVERVIRIIEMLGIQSIALKNPNELSGGQRQRVAFASIIVMEPEVLVIDEPTSQLDPKGTAEVFAIIHELKKSGKTVILVEHKIDLIAEYADEVLVIQNGSLVKTGTARDVLTDQKLSDYGVAMPQAAAIGYEFLSANMELAYIPLNKAECSDLIEKKWGKQDGSNDRI